MNTTRFTIFASLAALAASAAFATGASASKAAAQITFHEPEQFADFRMSESFSKTDAEILQKELSRAIERMAAAHLPPGYTLNVRFTDIDLAGDINPYHRVQLQDVREYRSVYPPRMTFDYTVTDSAGTVVMSGSERLVDLSYDMRLRMPNFDYTRIEADLMRDFISDIGHKLARGTG